MNPQPGNSSEYRSSADKITESLGNGLDASSTSLHDFDFASLSDVKAASTKSPVTPTNNVASMPTPTSARPHPGGDVLFQSRAFKGPSSARPPTGPSSPQARDGTTMPPVVEPALYNLEHLRGKHVSPISPREFHFNFTTETRVH